MDHHPRSSSPSSELEPSSEMDPSPCTKTEPSPRWPLPPCIEMSPCIEMESSRSKMEALVLRETRDPFIPYCPAIPRSLNITTGPNNRCVPLRPPVDEGTNSIALSIDDRLGTTLAIHKLNSEDVHWKAIGRNLIAYWADYEGSIPRCINAVAEMFHDEDYVHFHHLRALNWKAALDGWTCGSGTVTIYIRDFRRGYRRLLRIEISSGSVRMDCITETSSAIGVGASTALEVLNTLTAFTSCRLFETDEKLRQKILSKAIYEAAIRSSAKGRGCCEIIRGTRAQGWKSVSITDMETLVKLYRPHHLWPKGIPLRSHVLSYYKTPTEGSEDLPDRMSSLIVYREMICY